MPDFHGRCHCANLRYRLCWPRSLPALRGRSCGCTFCRKHGANWTSHPQAQLHLTVGDPQAVNAYRFGHATATFHVCARCGIVPLARCLIDGAAFAVTNLNTLDDPAARAAPCQPSDFEGETEATRLARRRHSWTPLFLTDE